MKQYNTREFKKILTNNGFLYDRTSGDHFIYKRENDIIVINNNINMMVAKRLVKTYRLEV